MYKRSFQSSVLEFNRISQSIFALYKEVSFHRLNLIPREGIYIVRKNGNSLLLVSWPCCTCRRVLI